MRLQDMMGIPARCLLAALLVAGCEVQYDERPPVRPASGLQTVEISPRPAISADAAVTRFRNVQSRVQPLAEKVCKSSAPARNCDFQIFVDTRPGQAVNAFQTQDRAGRPVIVLTAALLLDARSDDEIPFVLGHEAGHHIAGHLDRQRDTSVAGALIAGALAAIGGADPGAVRAAQDVGATVGARTFSKDFELEADALGTVIAFRSGYDPERGAGFFSRLPDPGNRFLGTHPPNAARIDVVRRTLADLRAQRGV